MNYTNKKILYVMTDNASIDDIMWGLLELGLETEYSKHRPTLFPLDEEIVPKLIDELAGFDLAITHNFSVNVAEACHALSIPYVAWLFDSPQVTTYTKYAFYPESYIFSFDKAQAKRLTALGLPHVYHQPLAANLKRNSQTSITDADILEYSCDLSFIGQLYRNTSFENYFAMLSPDEQKVVENVLNDKVLDWREGKSIYNSFTDEFASSIERCIPADNFDIFHMDHKYAIETLLLPTILAQIERKKLLLLSSEICDTRLYTIQKDIEEASKLLGAQRVYPPIYDENMVKAYYSSKINLNVTLRSIETGAPQRIFDIMSVGGTVLSNYQEELTELFVPGKEIMLFESTDEYIDKIKYLLSHEKERITIGINGYKRIVSEYNFKESLIKIFSKI